MEARPGDFLLQVLEQVKHTFHEAISGLQAKAVPVNQAIVTILLDRSLTVLRQLRGITATYRMTARYAPLLQVAVQNLTGSLGAP